VSPGRRAPAARSRIIRQEAQSMSKGTSMKKEKKKAKKKG